MVGAFFDLPHRWRQRDSYHSQWLWHNTANGAWISHDFFEVPVSQLLFCVITLRQTVWLSVAWMVCDVNDVWASFCDNCTASLFRISKTSWRRNDLFGPNKRVLSLQVRTIGRNMKITSNRFAFILLESDGKLQRWAFLCARVGKTRHIHLVSLLVGACGILQPSGCSMPPFLKYNLTAVVDDRAGLDVV